MKLMSAEWCSKSFQSFRKTYLDEFGLRKVSKTSQTAERRCLCELWVKCWRQCFGNFNLVNILTAHRTSLITTNYQSKIIMTGTMQIRTHLNTSRPWISNRPLSTRRTLYHTKFSFTSLIYESGHVWGYLCNREL